MALLGEDFGTLGDAVDATTSSLAQFVENMNFVVDKLRNVPGTKVNLVCNTDVLCSKCVNKLDENQCLTQDKVAEFDRKTLEVFGLEETEYVYSEVVEHIKSIATEEKLDYIIIIQSLKN